MASNHHGRTTGTRFGGLLGRILPAILGSIIVQAGVAIAPSMGRILREAAVAAAAEGIVFSRRLQAMSEEARLVAEDIVAEARQRVGEEAPPPEAEERAREEH